MGQYLAVGIAHRLGVYTANLKLHTDEIIQKMKENGVPVDLYNYKVLDHEVYFEIKHDIFENEIADFLSDYYKIRFGDDVDDISKIASDLKTYDKIIGLAEDKRFEQFQLDCCAESEFVSLPFGDYLRYDFHSIMLSMCGKIEIECYGSLFDFFAKSIASRLSKYQLSKVLRVYITG